MNPPEVKRFLSKIVIGCVSDCWGWTDRPNEDGYGKFRLYNHRVFAHRLAWWMCYGKIPRGYCVCHKCDNPACVNPLHLFLGTHTDNMRDKMKKGRHVPVYNNCKLTKDQVIEIRKLYRGGHYVNGVSRKFLADKFKVSVHAIAKIVANNSTYWRGVR